MALSIPHNIIYNKILHDVDRFDIRDQVIPTPPNPLIDIPQPKQRKKFFYQISLQPGKQKIRDDLVGSLFWTTSQQFTLENQLSVEVPKLVLFQGNCYCCGASGHSQSYCPLKKCSGCGIFGHSQRICPWQTKNNFTTTTTTHIINKAK